MPFCRDTECKGAMNKILQALSKKESGHIKRDIRGSSSQTTFRPPRTVTPFDG